MNVKDILMELDIYKYIEHITDKDVSNNIFEECRIESFKKRDVFYFEPHNEEGLIFLNGKINLTSYVTDDIIFTGTWETEIWLGITHALGINKDHYEVTFLEDTDVLFLPLKKILDANPKENYELWVRISKMIAQKYLNFYTSSTRRLTLPTEVFFLKSLMENGGTFNNISIQDIAYQLHLNVRTLQRTIQNLENKKFIERSRSKKIISVISTHRVEEYLSEYSITL